MMSWICNGSGKHLEWIWDKMLKVSSRMLTSRGVVGGCRGLRCGTNGLILKTDLWRI